MKYGKTESEIDAEKSFKCRQIVKEILNFGVTEDQKLNIIYLMALELEDRDKMLRISKVTKSALKGEKSKSKGLITNS